MNFIEEDIIPIVIDNGSNTMKVGFSGDDVPRTEFKTIHGEPRYNASYTCFGHIEYVGDEVLKKRRILNIVNPIERGEIINFHAMEKIWHYTFYNELRVEPVEHPVFMTENPTTSKQEREKMTEIMFEYFNTPAFYIGKQGVLSLYSIGKLTGTVINSGHGCTCCVPVEDGFMIKNAVGRIDFGGKDVTNLLMNKLNENRYTSKTLINEDIVNKIKETFCYVSDDYQNEIKKDLKEIEQQYILPDGEVISIGKELFEIPEILFQSTLFENSFNGIHELINYSLMKCNDNIRNELFENIVITGGNSLIKNFDKRLKNELKKIPFSPTNINFIEIKTNERKYSDWLGGSIFAYYLPSNIWIMKEEYDEFGPSIIHKKCY